MEGSRIRVVPSAGLTEIHLDGLLGEVSIVLEDLTDEARKSKGYMVLFPGAYRNEYVWFIPQSSVHE